MIYKASNGKWSVRLYDAPDANGKRGRRQVGSHDTKYEAQAAERAAIDLRNRGTNLVPEKATVGQIVERYIKKRVAIGKLSAKGQEGYAARLRCYIAPAIGNIEVGKLRRLHVEEMVIGLRDRKLSARSVHQVISMLTSAVEWAYRNELVARNVCKGTELPPVPPAQSGALEDDELGSLFAVIAGSPLENLVRLALATGCRRGELLALKWGDIDFEAGIVTISRALSQLAKSVLEKGTKSGKTRRVPLGASAIAALRRQRASQFKDKLRCCGEYLGAPGAPEMVVFADALGRRFSPVYITNIYRRVAKAAGLSSTRLHTLRHCAASYMIAAGEDVRSVADILGHANTSMTLNVYGHAFEEVKRPAIDRLDERLSQRLDSGRQVAYPEKLRR